MKYTIKSIFSIIILSILSILSIAILQSAKVSWKKETLDELQADYTQSLNELRTMLGSANEKSYQEIVSLLNSYASGVPKNQLLTTTVQNKFISDVGYITAYRCKSIIEKCASILDKKISYKQQINLPT